MMSPRKSDRVRNATRRIIAEVLASKDNRDPYPIAERRWGAEAPNFYERDPVGGLETAGSGLIANETALLDLVLESAIIGRLGLRSVPPESRVASVDTGVVAQWSGEGQAKPLGMMNFSAETLTAKRVAAMVVVSNEVLAQNSPSAEGIIRDDLVRAVSAVLDEKFLSDDPASLSTPAGILANVSPITANSDVAHSLRGLLDDFEGDLSRAVFVARPSTYAAMTSATYLRVGLRDGTLLMAPALVSKYAPAEMLLLIDPLRIGMAISGIAVSSARNASIEMSSAPMGSSSSIISSSPMGSPPVSPPDTVGPIPSETVSMWQTNSVALRAEAACDWRAASGAVSALDTGAWSGTSP
jgi:hypothetical protein